MCKTSIESIGQYTELTDKNGVKIFVGIKLNCVIQFDGVDLPHCGIVVYSSDVASFCTRNDAGETPFYNHKAGSRVVVGMEALNE